MLEQEIMLKWEILLCWNGKYCNAGVGYFVMLEW